MRSQRQLRVGEEIRHAIAEAIQRGDVPWQNNFSPKSVITVTEVQMSPDLKNAHVFIMPLGGIQIAETVRALNDVAHFFKHYLAKHIQLRFIPQLTFKPDTSFDYAAKIDALIEKGKKK